MKICYSGRSRPSAEEISMSLALDLDMDDVVLERKSFGHADVNWGRRNTNATLNPNIENVVNKRVMRELFREHDVPMPQLIPFEDIVEHLHNGEQVVGRPDYHMKGRGFWLCKNTGDVARANHGTRRKKAATHFMEYIPDVEHEYRVHIFKGKSIRISEKSYDDKDATPYQKEYTTIKPTGPVKEVRRAAKKAMRAVGLDFGAVDVIVDKEGEVYVLEVNAAPGLGGTMPKLYAEVFKKWKEGLWT